MNAYFFYIANIHPVVSCVAIAICLIAYKAKQPYIKLLGLSQLLNVVVHLLVILFVSVLKINQNILLAFADAVEFGLISGVYYLATNRQHKTVFTFFPVAFALLSFVNTTFIQGDSINSFSLVVKSIVAIFFSLYYFYWLLQELPTTELQRLPMFWVNSAILIFYSGNLFLFVFTDYLIHVMNNDMYLMWTVHNVLKIIEILMIVVALWMDLRNIKSHS